VVVEKGALLRRSTSPDVQQPPVRTPDRGPDELRRPDGSVDVRGTSSTRPASAKAEIASAFQATMIFSSRSGGTRWVRRA
jgi:hypothetical protein